MNDSVHFPIWKSVPRNENEGLNSRPQIRKLKTIPPNHCLISQFMRTNYQCLIDIFHYHMYSVCFCLWRSSLYQINLHTENTNNWHKIYKMQNLASWSIREQPKQLAFEQPTYQHEAKHTKMWAWPSLLLFPLGDFADLQHRTLRQGTKQQPKLPSLTKWYYLIFFPSLFSVIWSSLLDCLVIFKSNATFCVWDILEALDIVVIKKGSSFYLAASKSMGR